MKAEQLFSIAFYQHEIILPIAIFYRYLRHLHKLQNLLVLLSQKSFKEHFLTRLGLLLPKRTCREPVVHFNQTSQMPKPLIFIQTATKKAFNAGKDEKP